MVYNSEAVKGYFDCHAWITVSQSYNMEKVLKIMKSQIREQSAGEIFTMEQLITLLRNSLQTKRYVIVFDDVWQTNFWDVIKHTLPSNNNGSRIIITTRSTIVVDSFKETPRDIVRELKPWSHELAWELFCKKAFCFEFEGRCPEGLKHLSHEIMSKCKGLPLVIAAVAGLLSTKEKVDHEWRKVLENLSNEFEMNHQLTRIPRILSFSYHDLPYHLKPCYLYFGIFPEDCLIEDKRLFSLWIAEGFIKSKRDKTLEQVAEEYLSELIQRNLVLYELRYGVQRWCMVHDLMREIILTMADESCFSQTLDNNTSMFQEKSRRFSIYGATKDVLKMVGGSKIRSIFLLNTEELSKSFTVTLFENCKLLKVLDFEDSPLCTLPKEVGNLFNLKYLSLIGTNVKVLPKTIGELHNLQTLNLCRTLVQELPTEINKLRKLRHLLAYQLNEEIEHSLETYLGVRMHEGIGSLEELQTLTCIAAYSNGVSFMKDLEKLRKLVVLRVSELTTEIGKALGTSVEKMNRLQKLHLISASEVEILDLKCISCPPPSLCYLSLRCRLHELPSWVSKIQNLRGLSLCFSRLNNEPLKCLKNLPNLAYLNMYQTYDGEILHFEEGSFQKLKQLVLRKLEGLKVVKIDNGALPLLEELGFGPFPLMKEIPSDIRHLTNLKSLEMRDMPREIVAGLQPNGGLDYWKIKHIPSVCFGYKYKGDIYDIYKLGSSDLLQRLQEQRQ